MSVDDMRMRSRLHPELRQDIVANIRTVAKCVVITFILFMQSLVGYEVTLKGSHLILVERGRIRAAPHIPHIIQRKILLRRTILVKVGGTDKLVGLLQQFMPPILFRSDTYMLETSVLIQGHGCVIKQVAVTHQIHAAVCKQATHMLLQLLAVHKRSMNLFNQLPFFIRQAIRVGRVDSREIGIAQFVFFAFIHKYVPFKVNLVQQFPVVHAKLRTPVYNLRFQFELDYRNRLVHLRNQPQCLFVVIGIGKVHLRSKDGARIIRIGIHCESSQRQQVDAVAVFQCRQVGIAHGHTDNVRYAGVIARCGAHPQYVMVAPLNVEVMVVAKRIHDDMRTRTTVVNIAHDVQRVDCKPLDKLAHGNDKVIRTLGRDNRTDNDIDIRMLVRLYAGLVQQLLNDIGELRRQRFAHFRACVFGRYVLADFHQLVQGDEIPVVQVRFLFLYQLQLLFRIINQRTDFLLLAFAQRMPEDFIHLPLYRTRSILQHMLKSLVLSMNIRQEMFRTFRQIQNSFQVDDFRTGIGDGRKTARQQLQIA